MNIEGILKALEREQIEAFFVENRERAREKALEIIEKKRTLCGKSEKEMLISWGGSVTLDECGIRDAVRAKYNALDPYSKPTPAEQSEAKRQALLSDVFLMGTNALCESGELVNIDGNGNRLGALIYGPDTVIVVLGKNKIVKNVNEAQARIKKIACPKNAKRLNRQTPCALNGTCGNCYIGGATICSHTVVTRFSTTPDRIKVIIVNEELGY
ncbi:MAG: lactate utilization protein [Clostridia bacterium]|nr:lactate utilization protein [Clostridia bacterium]